MQATVINAAGHKPDSHGVANKDWDALFGLVRDHMVVGVDLHTDHFLYTNPALQKMLGYSGEELQNLSIWELLEEPYRSQVHAALQTGLDNMPPLLSTLLQARTKSGDLIWLETHITSIPYKGSVARIANYLNVTETIALKQRMEDDNAAFYQVLDAMPIPIIIARESLCYANPAAEQWSGYTRSELEHTPIRNLLLAGPEVQQRIETNLRRRMAGEVFSAEYPRLPVRLKSGLPAWAHIVSRTIWHQNSWMDLMILTDVSSSVVSEAKVAQEREHYRKLSEIDGLTEIYNRRTFDTTLAETVSLAQREHQPMALLMVDIDHFKEVNDTFGHETGDRVLQEMTHVIQSHLRPNDHLFRYGGEEFMIIIPGTGPQDIIPVAERLRAAVAACDFSLNRPVTISMGIARMQDHDTPTRLVQRADRALYAAKRQGRNRVVAD